MKIILSLVALIVFSSACFADLTTLEAKNLILKKIGTGISTQYQISYIGSTGEVIVLKNDDMFDYMLIENIKRIIAKGVI